MARLSSSTTRWGRASTPTTCSRTAASRTSARSYDCSISPKARRAALTAWRSIARIGSMSRPLPAFRCSTPPASISARSRYRVSRPMRGSPAPTSACFTSRRAKVSIASTCWRRDPIASANSGGDHDVGAQIRQETRMIATVLSRTAIGMVAAIPLLGLSVPLHAKDFIKAERPQQRGYSQAVITEGGKTVWLAGQTATVDDSGKSLAGDFEGQTRQIFKLLNATLEKAGGKLGDMVQMTVFITDVRYGDRLTQIRREIFGDNFPGSALITITGLANPDAKIEIQGMAVIGSK